MNEAPGQQMFREEFTIAELSEWSQCPRRAWLDRLGAQPTKRTKKQLSTVATNAAKNAIKHAKSSCDPISGTDQYIEGARRRFAFQSSKEIQTEPQAKRYARNARDRFMEFISEREQRFGCDAEFGVEFCESFQIDDYRDPFFVKANIDAVLTTNIDGESEAMLVTGYILSPWPKHGRANRHSLMGVFNEVNSRTGTDRKLNHVYIHPLTLAVTTIAVEPFPDLYRTIDYALATAMKWIQWSGDEANLEMLGRREIVPAAPNERMCQGCRFYGGRWCHEIEHVDLNH